MPEISLQRLLKVCDPVHNVPWAVAASGGPITREEISTADPGDAEHTEVDYDEVDRQWHLNRIAWLAANGWDRPISVDVGVPTISSPEWPILDGNHRVVAAWYRGDETISAEVDGSVRLVEEIFGSVALYSQS